LDQSAVATGGLRERKKQRTRQSIADAAARLFAERGYENVAVVDVARAAEVAEQTVYNYFPTKEHLVLDLDDALGNRLVQLVRDRRPGVSPAAAIGQEALDFVDQIRQVPADQVRGGLGYLATVSPAIRRLSLEMTDRHAAAIATAITETTPRIEASVAKLQAMAVAWVFQTITDETGRRTRQGQDPDHIAGELRPIVTAMLHELDRWLSPSAPRRARRSRGSR
jgi:AcrR family transcriptional regulator